MSVLVQSAEMCPVGEQAYGYFTFWGMQVPVFGAAETECLFRDPPLKERRKVLLRIPMEGCDHTK